MRKIALLTFAVLVTLGAGMFTKLSGDAAVSVQGSSLTGMEIHLKADTKNLPAHDLVDPL